MSAPRPSSGIAKSGLLGSRSTKSGSLERWKIAHVAARFFEGIESEYQALTRYLEARAPRSA